MASNILCGDIRVQRVSENQYLIHMWGGTAWHAVGFDELPMENFDITFRTRDFDRIEASDETDSLSGLYRNRALSTTPLYQQGYEVGRLLQMPHLTFNAIAKRLHIGQTTSEFREGEEAGRADYQLEHGCIQARTETALYAHDTSVLHGYIALRKKDLFLL